MRVCSVSSNMFDSGSAPFSPVSFSMIKGILMLGIAASFWSSLSGFWFSSFVLAVVLFDEALAICWTSLLEARLFTILLFFCRWVLLPLGFLSVVGLGAVAEGTLLF